MTHDISDPITIASVLVRDHLDTVIQRHGSRQDDPVSAAVFKLTTALLQHLPSEAKQARADAGRTAGAVATPVETGKADPSRREGLPQERRTTTNDDDLTRSVESMDHPASVSTRPPSGKG